MAKHIISFSYFKDNKYVSPKDRIPFVIKDEREGKYECLRKRFIMTKKGKFEHPGSVLPEDIWK
jgi:hypothetical protein